MLLGCKIHPDFYSIDKYKECVNRFDVWYINSDVYSNLEVLDEIYNDAISLNKRVHGYYLFSARLFNKNIGNQITTPIIRQYARNIIERYPLINDWELTHEAFNDTGGMRKDNVFYKSLTVNWQTIIFKQLKRDFPTKNFFYSDYIRNIKKANSVIRFVNETEQISGFNFQCHVDIIHPLSCDLIRYIYKNIKKRIVSLENVVWIVGDNTISFNSDNRLKKIVASSVKKKVYHYLSINRNVCERIQAYRYKRYLRIAEECGIEVFGLWTLSDNFYDMFILHPWQKDPGILDKNFDKKPAYNSIFS